MGTGRPISKETAYRSRLLDVLEDITRVSLSSQSMDDVLSGILDLVLDVFAADRAWFLFPCDPTARSYSIPMLRHRPQWPVDLPRFQALPMTEAAVWQFGQMLATPGPIQYGPRAEHPVAEPGTGLLSIKSQMVVALHPKLGKPWAFGVHHCAEDVMHGAEDQRLFAAIADRISDNLDNLISVRQLRDSEIKYRSLFELSTEGIMLRDVTGYRPIEQPGALENNLSILTNRAYQDCNEQAARMFGLTREQMLSIDATTLMPERQADGRLSVEVGNEYNSAAMSGRPVHFEWRSLRADGSAFDMDVKINTLEIGGRTYLQSVVSDITERKQMEAALRASEARLSSIFDATPDALLISDLNGVITMANPQVESMLGYKIEELLGKSIEMLVPASARQSHARLRDKFAASPLARRMGSGLAVRAKRKDGSEIDVEVSLSRIETNQGLFFASALRDITERKLAQEKINELAFFDQLTGLPNRTLLQDRLRQTMTASSRSGVYCALMVLDLDKFKMVNDSLGHDVGDLLLKQAAQRLTTCVRAGDTVARLGGDEFVVLLASLSSNESDAASQTEAVGEKILSALNRSYQLGDVAYKCTSSIGVTLFSGDRAGIEDLLKQADLAMYRSKAAGRNALSFFDPAMERDVMHRAALEHDLREAIERQQFLLHFQAQMADGRLTGAEALVRWQHPSRGMVSPGEFIHLAEETGLILPLGQWVLQAACAQLALWASRPQMADLTLAVNVSVHQFRQADFVAQVLTALKDTGADPRRLKLELTESLIVSNVEDIIDKMAALKATGVSFAIDDFGTGYSSLTYLKRMPLDQLKIDQSFVRDLLTDPNDVAIARTIVALGESLGMSVIAEGVETEAQRNVLARNGCLSYQGYLFSPPLPLPGFEAFVSGL